MDWLGVIAVLGTIGTLAGVALTIVYANRANRLKILVFDVAPSLPLTTILPERTEHRLSILYEREGYPPLNVRGAYLQFLQIANLGKEPIRTNDIARSDPLRIEITRGKVLDVALSAVSREVIKFRLGPFRESADAKTTCPISFDFLDSQDGAVIRVLTDSPAAEFRIQGTIVGMPQGIVGMGELNKNKVLNAGGCILAVLLQLAAVAAALQVFRSVTGGWTLLWVLLLPVGALLLPAVLVGIVTSTIWPHGPRWPSPLRIPDWFISDPTTTRYMYQRRDIAETRTLMQMMERAESSRRAELKREGQHRISRKE